MALLNDFAHSLLKDNTTLSDISVKNYLSDVRRFLQWYKQTYKQELSAESISRELITLYISQVSQIDNKSLNNNPNYLSSKSRQRHISSLRRFFNFLLEQNKITKNPLELQISQQEADPYALRFFKENLYEQRCASTSIKNYINDVQQFFAWLAYVREGNETINKSPFQNLTNEVINEYKNRLQKEHTPAATINRRLSSLRKYVLFLDEKKLINTSPIRVQNVPHNNPLEWTDSSVAPLIVSEKKESPLSRFPPIRLCQRVLRSVSFIFDAVLIVPLADMLLHIQYWTWILSGKRLFIPLEEIDEKLESYFMSKKHSRQSGLKYSYSATFFSPIDAQKDNKKQSTISKLFDRYRRLSSRPLFAGVQIGIISLLIFLFCTSIYMSTQKYPSGQVLSSTTASRVIGFTGKLLDKNQEPIKNPVTVRFALYNQASASGSALLWQEVQTVTPSNDGTFSVTLGNREPLNQTLFSDNPGLYLGTTVTEETELRPRQELPTVQLTANSQRLEGMNVLTASSNNVRNSILALDSTGNLHIGGHSSPIFQATNGTFTLSGENLELQTNPQSNGDIIFSPDGSGQIDIQKALVNTTNSGNIAGDEGAVAITDRVSILATSSAQPALEINQDYTGPLIVASTSGSSKFVVDYLGGGTFSDNLAVNGDSLTTSSTTFNFLPNNAIDVHLAGNASNLTLGSSKGVTTVNSPTTALVGNITIAGTTGNTFTGDHAGIQFTGNGDHVIIASAGALLLGASKFQGQITLGKDQSLVPDTTDGTNNLGASDRPFDNLYVNNINMNTLSLSNLTVSAAQSTSGIVSFSNTDPGNTAGVLSLKIGNTLPSTTNHYIDFINGNNVIVGSIQGSGTGSAMFRGTDPGDFAEYLDKDPTEVIPPGSAVCIKIDGNVTQCSNIYNTIAGVVSTHPTVLAGNDKGDSSVIVGLQGQIELRVSTKGGNIQAGDPLTMSDIPGVAIKADKPGVIIGHALHSYSSDPFTLGLVLTLVQPAWYDPTVQLTSTGNLNLTLPETPSPQKEKSYQLSDINNSIITSVSAWSKATIANLTARMVTTKEIIVNDSATIFGNLQVASITTGQIITDSLNISGVSLKDYISRIIEQTDRSSANQTLASISTLQTQVISPIGSNDAVMIQGNLHTSGSATVGATLTAENLQAENASISGTLHAKKIIADSIEGLPLASQSATYITNITNVYTASGSSNPSSNQTASDSAGLTTQSLAQNITNNQIQPLLNDVNLASYSGQLSNVQNLNTNFLSVNQGLTATGPTSLSDTTIAGQLSINNQLILADTGINVLNADLQLQPLRQGGINILSGLVQIDTNGNLMANANAYFAKEVSINGTLHTSLISALTDQNLALRLASQSGQADHLHSSLLVQNASGSSILSLNQIGDLLASGSGTFSKIAADAFSIVRGAQADTSATETVASSSAGTAVIYKGQTERTIITPFVKASSLIYISTTSNPNGLSPYVARQTDGNGQTNGKSSFSIQVSQPATDDIHINWWIIN